MTRRTGWIVGGLAVLVLAGAAALAAIIAVGSVEPEVRGIVATPYDPKCADNDAVCAAWAEFRHAHPYPNQTFAAKTLPDRSLVLVISEPSPALSATELDALTVAAFGSSFASSPRRLRWYIGIDGWLEDLVLHLRLPGDADGGADASPLDDPVMRDRIALLYEGLFGTTFGGGIEPIGSDKPVAIAGVAPNLQVSPAEIRSWIDDPSRKWQPNESGADVEPLTWSQLRDAAAVGTFTSDEQRLVMLTFPTSYILAAQNAQDTRHGLEALRVPFREFSVLSDGVFGGIWQRDGQTAILARGRTEDTSVVFPLRFETFALLASESSDELAQSYERNTVFAGKLLSGEYEGRDWAPIYLSESLIDTELGALLNITDQMLKSWSQKGAIEYLYFAHAKPERFPFTQAVSHVVSKRTKSNSTLFNWNTSGAAVVIAGDDFNVMAATRTGALPVTYGADGKPHSQGGADLMDLEDKAFEYFAKLKNPNLSRVAQYTALYQLFRAIARESSKNGSNADGLPAVENHAAGKRAGGMTVLARRVAVLLDDLAARRLDISDSTEVSQFLTSVEAIRRESSQLSAVQFAALVAASSSPEVHQHYKALHARRQEKWAALEAERQSLLRDANEFKELLVAVAAAPPEDEPRLEKELSARSAAIDVRARALKSQKDALEAEGNASDPLTDVRLTLTSIAQSTQDLDEVMREFVKANDSASTSSSIRTPSVVVSWDRGSASSIGGHNVDARAVRFVRSTDVDDIDVSTDSAGAIVRYNPKLASSIESRATQLARDIEHRQQIDAASLSKNLGALPLRNVREALDSPRSPRGRAPGPSKPVGSMPLRGTPPKELERLQAIAKVEACCIFIGRGRDNVRFAVEQNLKAPPPVITRQIFDTPSLVTLIERSTMRGNPPGKPVIFVNESEAHVRALAQSVEGEGASKRLTSMAKTFAGASANAERNRSGVQDMDLRQRKGLLQTLGDLLGLGPGGPFRRLTRAQPPEVWAQMKVSKVDPADAQALLTRAGWDIVTDGVPVLTRLSVEADVEGQPLRATVMAGFAQGRAEIGHQRLIDVTHAATVLAAQRGASMAQVLMTVQNDMRQYSDDILRRLVTIPDDQSGIFFTRTKTSETHVIANE